MKHWKQALIVLLIVASLWVQGSLVSAEREGKSYDSWTSLAQYINGILDESLTRYEAGDPQAAKDLVNEAYFGNYEVDGFEKTVMANISGKRVAKVEAYFHKAKLLASKKADFAEFQKAIQTLKDMILEDGQNLDAMIQGAAGTAKGEDKDSAKTGGTTESGADQQLAQDQTASHQGSSGASDGMVRKRLTTFMTSFGLVLREGLEAILIVVAILAYLDKTGKKRYVGSVYVGALSGIAFSILMAVLFNLIKDATLSKISQEIFEGVGFFVAALVLFLVSNWMLGKSEVEAWNRYIEGKVESSLSKGSVISLALTAFLAVSREGAELILFFQGIVGQPTFDMTFMWIGIAAAALALVLVYLLIRVYSVRLPFRAFFYATSALMFVLAVVFVGKGVFELQEADAISRTYLFGSDYDAFQIDWLGIYDRLESLIPQLLMILFVLACWIWNAMRNRRIRRTIEEQSQQA